MLAHDVDILLLYCFFKLYCGMATDALLIPATVLTLSKLHSNALFYGAFASPLHKPYSDS